MGKVIAVCRSDIKGIQKKDQGEGLFLEEFGLENDAHAGNGTVR